jgi:hypothetical protein
MRLVTASLLVAAAFMAALYARQELSVGGQFDLESIAIIGMLFTPVVFLPLVLPVILLAAAVVVLFSNAFK